MIKLIFNYIDKFKRHYAKNLLIDRIDSINIYHKFIHILAGLRLKRMSAKCSTLEDFYKLITSFHYSFRNRKTNTVKVRLAQKKYEIIEFIKEVAKIRARVIFEIGTYDGGTLFLLTRYTSPNAIFISLDLPILRDKSGYPPYRIPFYKFFTSKNQKIFLIRGDSHDSSVFKKIKRILKKKEIDILFIDGDHSYEGVKKDFEMYSPLVRNKGIIAFHDIVVHPPELKCEVSKFWNEIKENYDYREIIQNSNQDWAGIGLLRYEKK